MVKLPKYPSLFSILYVLFSLVPSARAQSVGLSISPPVVEILLAPTKKVTQTFVLKNPGEAVSITASLHRILPSDSLGHVQLEPTPLDYISLPLLINTQPPLEEPRSLPAGGTLTYTLTLEGVSSDIPLDSYFALVVQIAPPVSPESIGTTSTTNPGISALILTTLAPSAVIPTHVEITDFDPPLIHDSMLPLHLTPNLNNDSSIMIRPEGTFTVISPRGAVASESAFIPHLILGENSRTQSLTWQPRWFHLGPYRLQLHVTTAGGSTLVENEKVVWILPLRALILLTIILILLLSLTFRSRHSTLKP